MSLTVADVRSAIAKAAKICAEDDRVYTYLTEACERLLWEGVHKDTYGRFRIVATNKTISWPREVESILTCAFSNQPGTVRNGWYEFLQQGPGLLDDGGGDGLTLVDRQSSPIITDFTGAQTIRLYPSLTSDNGKLILVEGLDGNDAVVRSEYPASSGTFINGQYAALATPFVALSGTWTSITKVQKALTNGTVTVKAYDGSSETTIAVWDPDDTRPEFRRSLIPGLETGGSVTLTIQGKLRQLPLRHNTDWVIPPNLAALRQMVQAIWFEENEDPKMALTYEAMAAKSLQKQWVSTNGGAKQQPNVSGNPTFALVGIKTIQ